MQRRLRATKGPLTGALYVLSRRRTTIGRGGDVDIQVLSKGISRNHCSIELVGEGVILVDNESTNGTMVDDKRIKRHTLHAGQSFSLGEAVFRFEEDADGILDGPPTEELDLKVASGPAVAGTVAFSAPLSDDDGCGHPLHALARESRWKHCPHCGGPTSPE